MSTPTIRVRVARKSTEASDICRFELVGVDGAVLPPFTAGAHIDVHISDGCIRQYSLCEPSSEAHHYVIAVLRDPKSRGGSVHLHDQIKEGDTLVISEPQNQFPLEQAAERSILVAGGIGVTPIICMADSLAGSHADFEMHYCTRSADRTAFRQRIEASPYADKVAFHYDDGPKDSLLDIPKLLAKPQARSHVYFCGPTGFMDAILKAAKAAGWPKDRIHYEFFANRVQAAHDDASFEVEIASSGQVVVVSKDQTVVEALEDAGIDVPTSCEEGICGTCLTPVISGEPDHRDVFLSPEQHALNNQFTPCCSRSKSPRLVLDL